MLLFFSNKPGYITFAKTGAPDSRTSQLFINVRAISALAVSVVHAGVRRVSKSRGRVRFNFGVQYVDNKRLDSMGFAPFGEIEAPGM